METSAISHAYGGDVRIRSTAPLAIRATLPPVRRVQQSPGAGAEQSRKCPRVAFDDFAERPGMSGAVYVVEVGNGEPRPAWLELDADGAAVEACGLDERRADPAHGIDHEVAGVAVGFDRAARERRQHLRGVAV